MRLEVRKYLYDIQRAVDLLTQFTAGKQPLEAIHACGGGSR